MKRLVIISLLVLNPFVMFSQKHLDKLENNRLIFNAKEKAWIKKNHIIRVRVGNVPPFHSHKKGMEGISISYMNMISKYAGLRIKYINNISWAEALNNISSHEKIDLLLTAKITKGRKEKFVFTKEYIFSPLVIFRRKSSRFISSISDLKNKKVSVENSYVIHEKLRQNYTNIKLLVEKTSLAALNSLAKGKVDAYIGNLTIGTYLIENNGLNNIKVAAPSPFSDHNQAMLIRNDWPELGSIINKVLDSLSQNEIRKIEDKWLSPIRYEYGVRLIDIIKWVVAALFLFIVILFSVYYKKVQLEKEIKSRREAEVSLIKAKEIAENANKVKSDFLSNMSHELRTPLNAVLGFSQILREQEESLEKIEMLDIVLDSGDHLLGLIENVLDLAKIELGGVDLEKEKILLDSLVKQVKNIFAESIAKKGVEFKVKVDEKMDNCFIGDELRIKQILINLINNSQKFTNTGSISLSINKKSNKIEFIVEDTGIGITEKNQRIVFDRFVQGEHFVNKKYGGSGIGLAIVRELVAKMKGCITIESEKNVGSKFVVTIPLEIVDEKCLNNEIKQIYLTNKIKKILVAEDEKVGQFLLEKLFTDNDVEIIIVEDGLQVLEKLEEENYDLILMDIQMPRMTGVEATMEIRASTKSYRNIPILALTAYAFEQDRDKFLSKGMNGYVSKPIIKKVLFNEINKLFK